MLHLGGAPFLQPHKCVSVGKAEIAVKTRQVFHQTLRCWMFLQLWVDLVFRVATMSGRTHAATLEAANLVKHFGTASQFVSLFPPQAKTDRQGVLSQAT